MYGSLTDETKAVWPAILDSLAAPHPTADGTPDERSAGQRHHDALLEAGLRLLRSGSLPPCGGVPVTVLVRVDADDLERASRGQPGGVARTAHGDIVSIDRLLRLASAADITTVVLAATGGSWTTDAPAAAPPPTNAAPSPPATAAAATPAAPDPPPGAKPTTSAPGSPAATPT